MKQNLKNLNALAVITLLVLSFGLTACGDDNDEPNVPDTWTTTYEASVTFHDDFFEVADITAHIVKPDGTVTEEAIIKPTTTWTMSGNHIPDKAGILFTFVPKENIDPDRVYHFNINGAMWTTSYKNGEKYSSLNPSPIASTSPIKGNMVVKYLTGRGVALTAAVTSEGQVVSANADDFDFGLNGVWEWLAGVLTEK